MPNKVTPLRPRGAVEVEIAILESGECQTSIPDNLTDEQKQRVVRGLRKLQEKLQQRTTSR